MARSTKKPQKKLDLGKVARRLARKVGQPPPERVIPDKRMKPQRHKKPMWEEER